MRHRLRLAAAVLIALAPLSAQAQETSGSFSEGAVLIGYDNRNCDASLEGSIRYNSAISTIENCDGSEWKKIIASSATGDPSTPSPSDGYFVLTSGTFSGSMGSITGANASCLTDLTNNDWLGKADAQARSILDAAHIVAFLCAPSPTPICQSPLPSVTYRFAVSGDATKGGATFTTDGSSVGPGNTQSWSGTNYFDGSKTYWTQMATTSSTQWSNTADPSGASAGCSAGGPFTSWNSTSGTRQAVVGTSNASNETRWNNALATCGTLHRLICMVHP